MSMTTEERKYRFSEIMTAIHLIADDVEDVSEFRLPNGTAGLSDGRLKSAIMCQVFKEDEEFSARLVNALASTAMERVNEGNKPTRDDMSALSIAIHTCWGVGAFTPLLALLGVTGKVAEAFDVEVPDEVSLVFRPNAFAKKFGEFNPLDMCDENMDEATFKQVMKEVLKDDEEGE